jgi:hypothetical protein
MNLVRGILGSTAAIAYFLAADAATGAAAQALGVLTISLIAYGMIAKAGR